MVIISHKKNELGKYSAHYSATGPGSWSKPIITLLSKWKGYKAVR